ncbi:N-acetylneuraminate synthase [Pontixanthobacter gangjinensis]|uniref:N-acetylneuraminate synthase n=1 Tax=Christiangramia aestuarii TaxID=1028746 RepID=A0A7K1LLT0_9FLAO|nr:N-acetylneuraminate synthase family protein [Christiangramia aestuarii]MUP41779.1 N-acetylneuraminate synthase [Christiangramia aestuarii]
MMIIAEIGQAHEGSLGMAMSYIDALAEAGVDTVKFQVHVAEAESSVHEPFRIKFSDQDKSRFDYWKRMEFSLSQWIMIKDRCEKRGVEFLASPFSNAAVDLLEEIGVRRYKIGSGEVNNLLLLEKISRTGKPVIISSGLSSFSELDRTVGFLKKKKVELSILQCTTSYPTRPESYGLNVIKELKERYQVQVGFSDHSARIETCIAAFALGAEILEFHAVFSRKSFGPDATSSLEIEEIKDLVSSIKKLGIAFHNPVNKTDNSDFNSLKDIFEKSLAVNKKLEKGHIIQFDDLETKKPKSYGINAADYQKVLGRKVLKSLEKWDFLNWNDLQDE